MATATRRCIKCGREVGPDQSMCEVCNRAGMVTPAATQVHGTIFVAIVLGVVLLALGSSLLIGHGGPYPTTVVSWQAVDSGALRVRLGVTNAGEHDGRARCQITVRDSDGAIAHQAVALSPELAPQASTEFETDVPEAGAGASTVEAECQ